MQMLALAVGKDWSTHLTGEGEQINMHMLKEKYDFEKQKPLNHME